MVLDIARAVGDISDGVQQQAVNSNDLVKASDELSSLIATNASIAQETAAQAATLAEMAEDLQGLVGRFKL